MSKKQLIGLFKAENIALGILISILALVLFFTAKESSVKGMSLGLMFGLWIGVIFNHFVQIPKVYGNKDERGLMLMIIAVSISLGVAFLSSYLVLTLQVFGVINLSISAYINFIMALVLLVLAIRYGGYALLDRNL